MPGTARTAEGSAHFAVALRLALGGLVGCVVLQLCLYLRPSPYGGPFLLEWQRYFLLALYYEVMGVWLLSLPFFAFWLSRYRRAIVQRTARVLHIAHATFLTLNLFLSQLDHEALRFLGIRLGFSFAATYVRAGTVSDSLFFDILGRDQGGPYLSAALALAVPALFAWWARRRIHGLQTGLQRRRLWLGAAVVVALVPLLAPANGWRMASSQFRLRKVEPVTFALAADLAQGFADIDEPRDLARLAADYQARWLRESTDKSWTFPDPQRPYLRVPDNPGEPELPWNVILIQLETLRGMDAGHLNTERRPSPTPYLDFLAQGDRSAVYTRTLSFAQPSINALFAAHCSITPHSRRYVTSLTHARFYCLPEVLRRHGFRTEMFNAGDTDWDGATWWLTRWYDALHRYPDARERDRPVFRAAARRIRELGSSGRPFLASVVSVTNHTPFISRAPAFDIAGKSTARERILNTTRYTDDVVREFLEGLSEEPWFDRTIVVIFGDHGFNLGEHGGPPGEITLYREGVWVPLLIVGDHPRLSRGRVSEPASLLDVAPTVADLLGIREANPWQGHSLLAAAADRSFYFTTRDTILAEAGLRTLVTDPSSGTERLYDRERDWLERAPLLASRTEQAALARRATDAARLNDYLLRANRVWQISGSGK